MGKVYLYAADFIRDRRFEVMAPQFYHPHTSSDTVDLKKKALERVNRFAFVTTNRMNTTPFRVNLDPTEMQNCSYTVEIMLDLFRKKIVFELVHDYDIVEILDGLDRYLLSLQHDVTLGVELSTAWARLCVAWRTEVYKHYYRYMKLNPAAAEELYPRNDKDNNIFTLMASIGGISYDDMKADPLRSRSKPPYDIDKISPKPVEVERPKEEVQMEENYGINKYRAPVDDGAHKWDFDNFMAGSR